MPTEENGEALFAVVTGMEHSGTSFLSYLLKKNISFLEGGFECGALLADRPADFRHISPFYRWLSEPVEDGHWGLSPADVEYVCGCDAWSEFYARLRERSPRFDRERTRLLDKTPSYVYRLSEVAGKIPDTPILVIRKSADLLYLSRRRRGENFLGFCRKYWAFCAQVRANRDRIHLVAFERLCTDTLGVMRRIFRHLGLELPRHVDDDVGTMPGPTRPDFSLQEERERVRRELSWWERLALRGLERGCLPGGRP